MTIKILCLKNDNINQDILINWAKSKNIIINFKSLDDKYIPNQLINCSSIVCNDKINQVIKLGETEEYNYIMSIEFFLETTSTELKSSIYIMIKDIKTKKIYNDNLEEGIITFKILKDYPLFSKIINDLYKNYKDTYKNYIYSGSEINFGELINKYYPNISKENWTNNIINNDRLDSLRNLINITFEKNNLLNIYE